jgi:hypothetical protein
VYQVIVGVMKWRKGKRTTVDEVIERVLLKFSPRQMEVMVHVMDDAVDDDHYHRDGHEVMVS